ncbi:membrane-bound alpha-1,6- mannosyltransferase Initiation-specific [Nowakowskiella sp. JEL0078]|nr:membrane-bound alpha-1,6- mannosyltransferase Initiation-specific [Nowakowskiella sp. JEL0078]
MTGGKGLKGLTVNDVPEFTGPGVWTKAVYGYWRELGVDGFRMRGWGENARLFEDMLVLPITAFSPGLGQILTTVFGNMGSKPLEDPDALVRHQWKSVWRSS